jgi:hypothetical protein
MFIVNFILASGSNRSGWVSIEYWIHHGGIHTNAFQPKKRYHIEIPASWGIAYLQK